MKVINRSQPEDRDLVYYMEKTLVKLNEKKTLLDVDQKKLVDDYEQTLNSSRLVYCGCGTTMIGTDPKYTLCPCPLHALHGEYVFDPACSESCRDLYSYSCKYCSAFQGRVFGPGNNGELRCSSRCMASRLMENEPMNESETLDALRITHGRDKREVDRDGEMLKMLERASPEAAAVFMTLGEFMAMCEEKKVKEEPKDDILPNVDCYNPCFTDTEEVVFSPLREVVETGDETEVPDVVAEAVVDALFEVKDRKQQRKEERRQRRKRRRMAQSE